MPNAGASHTTKQVLEPADAQRVEPALAETLNPNVWVYRYTNEKTGWVLSIATHAEPGSHKLSLGGFRIAPESRTSLPGFDPDREAIELAIGMEEKVYWSRVLHVGGPLAQKERGRIVGGKCVLKPTADARVGQPRDREMLDWAVACFREVEASYGFHLVTGQDLGHGVMSDGKTQSLDYLNARFKGSQVSDTSIPTAEGNFDLLRGMLRACDIPMDQARVGVIGAGNIGRHIVERLFEYGTTLRVVELNPKVRAMLAEKWGIAAVGPEEKERFLQQPLDAVVVNAAGGTLDPATVRRIAANEDVRIVCGSENLTMPDPNGARELLAARVIYCPTELGGMMGYLTAVEEYLAARAGKPFHIRTVLDAAKRLEVVGYEVTSHVIRGDYRQTFEEAVHEIYGEPASV